MNDLRFPVSGSSLYQSKKVEANFSPFIFQENRCVLTAMFHSQKITEKRLNFASVPFRVGRKRNGVLIVQLER